MCRSSPREQVEANVGQQQGGQGAGTARAPAYSPSAIAGANGQSARCARSPGAPRRLCSRDGRLRTARPRRLRAVRPPRGGEQSRGRGLCARTASSASKDGAGAQLQHALLPPGCRHRFAACLDLPPHLSSARNGPQLLLLHWWLLHLCWLLQMQRVRMHLLQEGCIGAMRLPCLMWERARCPWKESRLDKPAFESQHTILALFL
ncbi:uncharacterized protein LOC130681061 [Manis pentadactyla]|uniref:uncharacterized protein LOC130681061 n=1 Tax=Manis pentadactyla TaxID=143292 RepID=UPI00255CF6A5|nr:uncharacterized protein LOC130681061 [Manis pentadactyla]